MSKLFCIQIYGCAARGTERAVGPHGSFTSPNTLERCPTWRLLKIAQVSEYKCAAESPLLLGSGSVCFPQIQYFRWRTIPVSACEGCMLHKGQESSSRKLVWVEGQSFGGWGCSECAWVFNLPPLPTGKSLDEVKRNFETQLSEEFASHACAKRPRAKGAKSA